MSARVDDDVYLHKASATLLAELSKSLEAILWKPSGAVHRRVRMRDLNKALSLVEPFQEEPQLLDPHLKTILPPLVNTFLLQLEFQPAAARPETCAVSYAICKILYTICKVRGEKVIVSFLDHDPPIVNRILNAYEDGSNNIAKASLSWEERYVLMLWLWHLMLIPFDLRTLSEDKPEVNASKAGSLTVPPDLPAVAQRIVLLCVNCLSSATKERDVAAKLLARISLRSDVRDHGLLVKLIPWALQDLRIESNDPTSLHQRIGLLSFLSSLTASAAPEAMADLLHKIYTTCHSIVEGEVSVSLSSNAVARKLLIKIYRHIALLCLKTSKAGRTLDPDEVLTEVIGSMLTFVGDSDAPVRYAASKALSAITLSLEPSMAGEVVEAILTSLREDVLLDESGDTTTNSVNALRWHGLTLTLAQLLYRRAPSTNHLPDVLEALILSLQFSQRSATGVMIGTNVRDAACFGIWALSRRYTTKELLAIDPVSMRVTTDSNVHSQSTPVLLATHLLAAACLDPAGNIRRGSSAALQELIGRHPDTVPEGIALVQVVDYQAVGLRRRAMIDVGARAADLDQIYWDTLYTALQGERGIFASDELSRACAAEALGVLVKQRGLKTVSTTLLRLQHTYSRMKGSIIVHDRHGLFLALAAVIGQRDDDEDNEHAADDAKQDRREVRPISPKKLLGLLDLDLLLDLPDRDYTSGTRNPHLTASATCQLISAITSLLLRTEEEVPLATAGAITERAHRVLDLCLLRTELDIVERIPQCVNNLLACASHRQEIVEPWLKASAVQAHSSANAAAAHVVALGAALRFFQENDPFLADRIIGSITTRCGDGVEVEERVLAVRALGLTLSDFALNANALLGKPTHTYVKRCAAALHTALNDYTINERGDVGSLVRLEALSTLEQLSRLGWQWEDEGDFGELLLKDLARLGLERLDKVRATSRKCVAALGWLCPADSEVSSSVWFTYWLNILNDHSKTYLRDAIVEGCIASAGAGAENVVQASRSALLLYLRTLPTALADETAFTLLSFANLLRSTFQACLSDERRLLPLLETLGFLLDMQVLQPLIGSPFPWRGLLSQVQRSHYQSKSVPKMILALDVYRSLAEVPSIRQEVLRKLVDMKRNPMTAVRTATEETLLAIEQTQPSRHSP